MIRIRNIAAPLIGATALIACAGMQRASAQTKTARAATQPANPHRAEPWRATLKQELPLLGHRNWILVVDSAYPLQTSAGVETIETDATMAAVTQEVLRDLDRSVHIRPIVYMDAELPFLSDENAPGVTRYRRYMQAILGDRPVTSLPHEQIVSRIDETGKVFHILVLKTTLAIPYTSVFLQLDCRYWSAASEGELRKAMKAGSK